MPDMDIEQELREQYPKPADVATERARAAVIEAATEKPRGSSRRTWTWKPVLGIAVAVAALVGAAAAGAEAFPRNSAPLPAALHFSKATKSTAYPHCPAKTGEGVFDPTLSPSSGAAGTTVTVSGPLPVLDESGAYVGQTASQVIAYWNLNLDKWWTALKSPLSPTPAVAGSAVQLLGTQEVAGVCNYSFQVKIPSGVAPGTYPIQLLTEASDATGVTTAPMPPANVQVTDG
jgi:hypothetical protein